MKITKDLLQVRCKCSKIYTVHKTRGNNNISLAGSIECCEKHLNTIKLKKSGKKYA